MTGNPEVIFCCALRVSFSVIKLNRRLGQREQVTQTPFHGPVVKQAGLLLDGY
jgi:hypothetical protein